ncbi:hypothetical protein GOBAR_AA28460 [Gossypium barbadense]|uniref:Cyclase family protein n=1 Tax=Gossypium barbadense TaxID=3634 RepID=A0A2P5WM95_GOSBA|nr:hypothetical protein GOBAR_AA28460 [Gossypium barbadense]
MPSWESKDGVGQFLWLPKSMKNGSLANNSEMKLPTHTGTHLDAPGHVIDRYFNAGFDVDTLDLEVLNAEVMESLKIPKGVRRVLFRTLNTDRRLMFKKEFDTSYVGFMKDGAEWLVKHTDIKFIGIDYLSVAAFDDLIPSHIVFLEDRDHQQDAFSSNDVVVLGNDDANGTPSSYTVVLLGMLFGKRKWAGDIKGGV